MRLLRSESIQLIEPPDPTPLYAILSHTWEGDEHEVTFQDIQNLETAKKKKGYQKIKQCCSQARRHGFEYVWVDTCCINKDSSTELSEAINSMYGWYQKSGVCYVYLSDVLKQDWPLFNARWFTRGWTLQELIAPESVIFYDTNWQEIGTKASLKNEVYLISGVSPDVLVGSSGLETITVAKKMSWASKRVTKKGEDLAYSLMGIFGVNMAILYGEGEEKAFTRLQEEIWKVVEDPTIFAWQGNDATAKRGLLAHSPFEFASMGDVERLDVDAFYKSFNATDMLSHSYMTNRGLLINLPLETRKATVFDTLLGVFGNIPHPPNNVLAALPCKLDGKHLVISLKKAKSGKDQYVRVRPDHVDLRSASNIRDSFDLRSVYVNEENQPKKSHTGGEFDVSVYIECASSNYSGYVSDWSMQKEHLPDAREDFRINVARDSKPQCFVYTVEKGTSKVNFAVILGIHQAAAWTKVKTDIEKQLPTVIAQSVVQDSDRTDRVYQRLGDDIGVSVSVWRHGHSHKTEVRICHVEGDLWPWSSPLAQTLTGPGKSYIMSCHITGNMRAFEVFPHPIALWRRARNKNEIDLFVMDNLTDISTVTYLEFKHLNSDTKFRVKLGVDTRGAWAIIGTFEKSYNKCRSNDAVVDILHVSHMGRYKVTIDLV